MPLFSKMIATRQHGVDEEMARRTVWWDEFERDRRIERAGRWRAARERLFSFDVQMRRTIRELWRTCPYPGDPAYFADLLREIEIGKVNPHRPPWRFHPKITARMTQNPTTFAEAFRMIGHKKIDGGPKTVSVDQFLYCGNLGAGLLFLTVRPRPIAPNEGSRTGSNHRLRDAQVGRADRWVDIEVRGQCSDADLVLIERLAQAAHTLTVVVQRIVPPAPARIGAVS